VFNVAIHQCHHERREMHDITWTETSLVGSMLTEYNVASEDVMSVIHTFAPDAKRANGIDYGTYVYRMQRDCGAIVYAGDDYVFIVYDADL